MWVPTDFHGFYHLGMSQAWVSKEPIIVFPTEGTLKMFTKTDQTFCSKTVWLAKLLDLQISLLCSFSFVMEHSFNNQQFQQMKTKVQISWLG